MISFLGFGTTWAVFVKDPWFDLTKAREEAEMCYE